MTYYICELGLIDYLTMPGINDSKPNRRKGNLYIVGVVRNKKMIG